MKRPSSTGGRTPRCGWRRGAALAIAAGVICLGSGMTAAQAEAAAVDLTITAEIPPSPLPLLYPGATGDVVARITNPNSFTVTISEVMLPSSRTYAIGYDDPQLNHPRAGCDGTDSEVSWNGATPADGTTHDLTTPLSVGGGDSLVVTFRDAALMGFDAPAACEGVSFRMPSFSGIGAVAAPDDAITSSPTIDGWKFALPVPPPFPTPSPSSSTGDGITAPTTFPPSEGGAPATGLVPGEHRTASGSPSTRPSVGHGQLSAPSQPPIGSSDGLDTKPGNRSGSRRWLDLNLGKIVRSAKYVAVAGGFTLFLFPFLLGFLAIQHLIDKRDPKLARAPAYADHELPFLPR